jgi:hypothetical protein
MLLNAETFAEPGIQATKAEGPDKNLERPRADGDRSANELRAVRAAQAIVEGVKGEGAAPPC